MGELEYHSEEIESVNIGGAIDAARREFVKLLAQAETPHEMLQLRALAQDLAANVREWKKLADEEIMLAYPDLDEHIGDTRYYVAPVKKTKPIDSKTTFSTLAEALGGEFEAIERCLSQSATTFKHGQVRKELEAIGNPDMWHNLFKVEEVPEVKEGKATGDAKKAVHAVNERFIN